MERRNVPALRKEPAERTSMRLKSLTERHM